MTRRIEDTADHRPQLISVRTFLEGIKFLCGIRPEEDEHAERKPQGKGQTRPKRCGCKRDD